MKSVKTYTIKAEVADILSCDIEAINHVYTYEEVAADAENFEMTTEEYIERFMDEHEDVARRSWKDGWHQDGELLFYIEDGKIIRGVRDGKYVSPYIRCKTGGYDNASGIKASKRNFSRVKWF